MNASTPPQGERRDPFRLIGDLRLDHEKLRADHDLLAQRTQLENAEMRTALTRLETGQFHAAEQRQQLSDRVNHGFEALDRRLWQFVLAGFVAALGFGSAVAVHFIK